MESAKHIPKARRACRNCRQRDTEACRWCGVKLLAEDRLLVAANWRNRLYTK